VRKAEKTQLGERRIKAFSLGEGATVLGEGKRKKDPSPLEKKKLPGDLCSFRHRPPRKVRDFREKEKRGGGETRRSYPFWTAVGKGGRKRMKGKLQLYNAVIKEKNQKRKKKKKRKPWQRGGSSWRSLPARKKEGRKGKEWQIKRGKGNPAQSRLEKKKRASKQNPPL